jgi:hypothetical protein
MTAKATVAALLDRHGRTYADELGIDLARGTPSPLFRWLCASMLYSARISAQLATAAARAMADEGWTTARHLQDSTWRRRVTVINHAGYARYDERTSTMFGELADVVVERWDGDLRNLREEAGREPARERALLKELKGIGDVGVDIFFREVQTAWEELRPFADRKALQAAAELGVGDDAEAVGRLAEREAGGDVALLVAALVRCALAKDADELRTG